MTALAEHWFSVQSMAHPVQTWLTPQLLELWFALGIPRTETAAICSGNVTTFVSCVNVESLEHMHRSDTEFFLTPSQPVLEFRKDIQIIDTLSAGIIGSDTKRQIPHVSHFCLILLVIPIMFALPIFIRKARRWLPRLCNHKREKKRKYRDCANANVFRRPGKSMSSLFEFESDSEGNGFMIVKNGATILS